MRANVRRKISRKGARLWFIDLNGSGKTLSLVVKSRTSIAAPVNAYRVVPMPDRSSQTACEGNALKRIETFPSDPGFEPLKVYEVDIEKRLIIMERIDGGELGSRVLAAHRFIARSAPPNLLTWCEGAGALLKTFHETMPAQPRRELPDHERLFNELQSPQHLRAAVTNAFDRLNPDPTTSVLHGDFWPGNILIRSSGKIAIIDPVIATSGPVYIDLANFLVHLRMMQPQVYSHGFWNRGDVIAACENAFLRGYFGEQTIDWPSMNFFQALILLCKWASVVQVLKTQSPVRGALKQIQLQWREPYFRRLMHDFLNAR